MSQKYVLKCLTRMLKCLRTRVKMSQKYVLKCLTRMLKCLRTRVKMSQEVKRDELEI